AQLCGHFAGSPTSSSPAAAAARVRRSAASRLRSRSGVDCSWTAAARTAGLLPQKLIDVSVNAAIEHIVRGMAFRKQWRWLGAFGPDAMLCVARAAIGP